MHLAHLSLQVRSEFDELLLNHARSCGVKVTELTRVKSLAFSDMDPLRPISATWTYTTSDSSTSQPGPDASATSSARPNPSHDSECPAGSITGTTTFDYVIDATGRAGIMSTLYLKNRRFNASLKNIALWGYWKDVNTYGAGTAREGAPWFEALTGKSAGAVSANYSTNCNSIFQMNPDGRGSSLSMMARPPSAS